MSLDAARLQAQVRANSTELASYLSDLQSWEKDIKRKEHSLQAGELKLTKPTAASKSASSFTAPIRSSQPPVPLASTASSDQQRFAVHKDAGNALYAKGEYRAAIAEYNQCAILLPFDALPLSNRAQCWLKLQQWSEAERDCSAALELDARNVKALYRRATARKGLGQLDSALADLDRVAAIEPNNKPALQLRREVEQALKTKAAAGISGARVAGAAKPVEQPRRKLVIEEEAEDDEEEEEEVFTVKRGTNAANKTEAAREEKEQSAANAGGKRAVAGAQEERKSVPPTVPLTSVGMDISTSPVGAQASRSANASPASAPASSSLTSTTSSATSFDLRVPRSALDFDSQYRRVRQQPAQLAVLLKLIPAADYPSILRTALDSSLLSAIVQTVSTMQASVERADIQPPQKTLRTVSELDALTHYCGCGPCAPSPTAAVCQCW